MELILRLSNTVRVMSQARVLVILMSLQVGVRALGSSAYSLHTLVNSSQYTYKPPCQLPMVAAHIQG